MDRFADFVRLAFLIVKSIRLTKYLGGVDLGKGFMDELRHDLEMEKTQLEETIVSLNQGLHQRLTDSVGELSSYDQHTADLGAETFERGKDVALRDNSLRLLADVNAALDLMNSGEYGICLDCGRPIDEARLRAIPSATRCIECKDAQEQVRDNWHRPVEELVIPFRLTHEDTVGFDGEDTWQELARFGTANTPQDIPGAVEYDEVYINADENIGIVEAVEAVEDDGLSAVEAGEAVEGDGLPAVESIEAMEDDELSIVETIEAMEEDESLILPD